MELAARHADLKAQHILYPFYVQKPEEETRQLTKRCEALSKEKEKYRQLCEEYAAKLRPHVRDDNPEAVVGL